MVGEVTWQRMSNASGDAVRAVGEEALYTAGDEAMHTAGDEAVRAAGKGGRSGCGGRWWRGRESAWRKEARSAAGEHGRGHVQKRKVPVSGGGRWTHQPCTKTDRGAGGGMPPWRWLRAARERPGTVATSRAGARQHVSEARRQRSRAPDRKSRRSRGDIGKSQEKAESSLIRGVTWAPLTWLTRAPKWDV